MVNSGTSNQGHNGQEREAATNPMASVFGGLVRIHRQAAYANQTAAAKEFDYDQSWLSRVENGRHVPDRPTVLRMEQRLGCVPGTLTLAYDALVTQALPASVRQWLPYERRAILLRSFQLSVVPGLLQTPEYAYAVMGNEAAVAARIDRQSLLTREDAPNLHCLIDEAVLYRQIGGVDVIRDQLERLVASVSSRVTIQVVPLHGNRRHVGDFIVATLSDGHDEVAYIETPTGGMVTVNEQDIANMRDAWKSILDAACPLVESVDMLRKVKEERWT